MPACVWCLLSKYLNFLNQPMMMKPLAAARHLHIKAEQMMTLMTCFPCDRSLPPSRYVDMSPVLANPSVLQSRCGAAGPPTCPSPCSAPPPPSCRPCASSQRPSTWPRASATRAAATVRPGPALASPSSCGSPRRGGSSSSRGPASSASAAAACSTAPARSAIR